MFDTKCFELAKSFISDMDRPPRNVDAFAESLAQQIQDLIESDIEAIADECSCRARPVRPNDISPPEIRLDRNCRVHGESPDDRYERWRDEQMEEL